MVYAHIMITVRLPVEPISFTVLQTARHLRGGDSAGQGGSRYHPAGDCGESESLADCGPTRTRTGVCTS